MHSIKIAIGGSALALVLLAGQAFGSIIPRTIALTGTTSAVGPNQSGNTATFTRLDIATPSINNAGQVVFRGDSSVTGTGSGNAGLWLHSIGLNSNFAAAGGAAPGGGNYSTSGFNTPNINGAGQTQWRDGTAALYGDNGGGAARLMATTTDAPGTGLGDASNATSANSARFGAFVLPALLSSSGVSVFSGTLTTNTGNPPVIITAGSSNAAVLYNATPGSNAALQLRGSAPMTTSVIGWSGTGLQSGVQTINTIGVAGGQPSINASGGMAWFGTLQGSGIATTPTVSSNNSAIFSTRTGSLEIIAQRGQAAPGTTGSFTIYDTLQSKVAMNNAGKVAFYSGLRDAAGVTTGAGQGVFTDTGGTLAAVAQTGRSMPAIANSNPGEFAGASWGTNFNETQINASGTIAFTYSGVTGNTNTNGGSMTMSSAGVFTKVHRTGDQSPALSTIMGDVVRFGTQQGGLALNARGQVAFHTLLTSDLGGVGGGVLSNGVTGNNTALFATDLDGSICLVAQKGMPFFVGATGPADYRIVSSFSGIQSSGNQDGRTSVFNDDGDLVIALNFSDGSSGVFVVNIPAPGGAALGLLGLGFAGRRRRR